MSARAFTKFQVGVFNTAEKIYAKFSALKQEELDAWTKKSKIEFPVSAGVRTMPDFEVHKFSNEGMKLWYVSKMKRNGKGAVEILKYAEELLTESNYQSTVEQTIVQKIVFDLRAEFYKEPEKTIDGKKKKGTGSKNITPYGVACADMFEMLGVEHTYKNEYKEIDTGFAYCSTLIKKPQTEKQKQSLLNGQTTTARKGVKKGKSQKTIQLENLLETANKELTTLKSFMLFLHNNGQMTLSPTDEQVFKQLIKEVKEEDEEITYKRGLGLADAQVSKSPSPSPSPEKVEKNRPDISEEFITDTDDEEEDQYKKVCDGELCDTVLGEDVPIMCYMNKERGDKTLCRVCYEDGDYKDDDENEDNMVCCVGCNEPVCHFDDEPPHKDKKDEAVCDDCWEEPEEDVLTEKDIMNELFTDDEEEDDESERKEREITALEEVEEFLEEYDSFDFNAFMKKIKMEDREAGGDRADKWSKDNKTDTINELLEEFIEMLEDWKEDLDDFPDLEEAIASWTDTLKERTE